MTRAHIWRQRQPDARRPRCHITSCRVLFSIQNRSATYRTRVRRGYPLCPNVQDSSHALFSSSPLADIQLVKISPDLLIPGCLLLCGRRAWEELGNRHMGDVNLVWHQRGTILWLLAPLSPRACCPCWPQAGAWDTITRRALCPDRLGERPERCVLQRSPPASQLHTTAATYVQILFDEQPYPAEREEKE